MRSRLSVLIVFSLCGAASADDAPLPPIRDFDVATIEKLGRAMYEQDQEAWKATDVVFAQHSRSELAAEKQHGWIVDNLPGRDVVRFFRETDHGPEIAYDVTFVDGKSSGPTVPDDKVPSADELARYQARTLALAGVDHPCSDTYNTIVLKDPQGEGWLVWAMAATTDPGVMVIGGHYRFTISKDGKTVERKDALSRSCLVLRKQPRPGGTVIGEFVSQLVSMHPEENHVFANLSYGDTLNVGTQDGRVWRIDQGKISEIYADSPDPDGFVARHFIGHDEVCKTVIEKPVDGVPKYFVGSVPGVIESTEHADKYSIEAPQGAKIVDVTCARFDIFPQPNDYKVLLAGYGLYLMDTGAGHPRRQIALTLKDGKVGYELKDGEPLDAERKARIDGRVAALQKQVDAAGR